MEKVKLISYLTGNCPFKGCVHSLNGGRCMCLSPDLIKDINDLACEKLDGLDLHKDVDKILDGFADEFTCFKAQAEEGHCLKCGEKLTVYHEDYEFMGKFIQEPRLGCMNCD